MVINRDYVKVRLQKIECKYRGYYGTDIAEIAKELNVTSFGLKKQISKWAKVDSSFAGFTCLGKHRPSITLDEFIGSLQASGEDNGGFFDKDRGACAYQEQTTPKEN